MEWLENGGKMQAVRIIVINPGLRRVAIDPNGAVWTSTLSVDRVKNEGHPPSAPHVPSGMNTGIGIWADMGVENFLTEWNLNVKMRPFAVTDWFKFKGLNWFV